MNSSRPYLVNALIDWIVDNGCTPHVVLDLSIDDVIAPTEYATENRLVINVSGTAVRNFKLDQDGLEFDARFQGQPHHVNCPVGAIVGIFAKENGEGMAFKATLDGAPAQGGAAEAGEDDEPKLPPHLRVVKD